MKLHNLIQGTPEWLAYRANHFNASDAPAMMGVSPYKTRAELLRELHTGLPQEVDTGTQRRFDNGHRAEALARPLAEEFIGEELYPATGSEGRLSASFDGLTMDDRIGFEHKALNNDLRKAFAQIESISPKYRDEVGSRELPIYHRIQMEQQLLISGAEKVLFMASEWTADGDLVEERHCWYYPDLQLRQQIVDGWVQFEKDLAAFVMPSAAHAQPEGKAPETLPALHIEVTGKVTASNLAAFKKTALEAIRNVNRELKTDQDFADAAKAVKWCSDVEERLQAAKQHALAQTASIDELFRTMDEIGAEARRVRLELDKLVTRRKTEVKEEAVFSARRALAAHYDTLNAELAPARLLQPTVDFAGAIKGLRSFDSMQSALDNLVAKSKIDADAAARSIRANFATYGEQDAALNFLFPDLHQLVHKSPEDFKATLAARIAQHQQAEQQRQEAERARIRAEEAARLEREQREAQAQAEAQARAQREAEEAAAQRQRDADQAAVLVEKAVADTNARAFVDALPIAAPAREVRQIHAAPEMPRNEPATLKLGTVCERLGFTMTAAFVSDTLGIKPAKVEGAARLYRESDFGRICTALHRHLDLIEEKAAA